MLRLLLIFIIIASFLPLRAQEKLGYYTLINKADSLIFEKKIGKAYSLYKKAVAISAINPYTDIELVKLSLKMNDRKKAKKYLELAIENGAFLDMIEADSNLNSYFKKDEQWNIKYNVLRQKHLARIPHLEERMALLKMLEKD